VEQAAAAAPKGVSAPPAGTSPAPARGDTAIGTKR